MTPSLTSTGVILLLALLLGALPTEAQKKTKTIEKYQKSRKLVFAQRRY